jgi:hypothetical protein
VNDEELKFDLHLSEEDKSTIAEETKALKETLVILRDEIADVDYSSPFSV